MHLHANAKLTPALRRLLQLRRRKKAAWEIAAETGCSGSTISGRRYGAISPRLRPVVRVPSSTSPATATPVTAIAVNAPPKPKAA